MSEEASLKDQVEQLQAEVRRLKALLASTGKQVMQLQIDQRKLGIEELGVKAAELQALVPAAGAAAQAARAQQTQNASEDYVTESDLTEMVGELQGQLTLLDERSIRRVLNSRSGSRLVALPNADGEEHPKFPPTLAALQALSDADLFEQWNHFEMLPNGETLDDLVEEGTTPEAKAGNEKVLAEIYESFVRYIGVNPREYPRKV